MSHIKLKVKNFSRDFSYKIEGNFSFLVNLFFLVRFIFEGISFVKMKVVSFFWSKFRKCNMKGNLMSTARGNPTGVH